MPEIKVNQSVVSPVLQQLNERTQDLDTTNPQPEFSLSTVNFIDKIQSVEESYYAAIKQYKSALLHVEKDIESSIQTYVEKDEQLAGQMGPQRID
ncbi:YwqI/YxiC family protein [Virgibacillus halodenitrificans]|uniref:YwqI/YxiC family protein n=1 Tax=Virgibacillus halodenitrificans TaxID=1482 RepID=UPI0007619A3A